MAEFALIFDQRTLQTWRERLPEKAIAKALQRALSDAARTMRTEATRYVRSKKRLKVGAVQKGLVVKFPKTGEKIEDLEAQMGVRGSTVGVIDYPGGRKTKVGWSVAINKGKRTVIPGAFMAKMKSGKIGVFVRKRTAAGSGGLRPTRRLTEKQRQKGVVSSHRVARLGIQELFTTRLTDVFRDAGMVPDLQGKALAKLAATFNRNAIIELNKLAVDR